jgi:hypothetical protein
MGILTTRGWPSCEQVSAEAARMADDHGLVCCDPQQDRLHPTAADERHR